MIAIKPEVEALIGEIDFLDNDYNDDGFITYWAERALRDGLETTEMLLSDMGYLKPLVERGIGRVLNLFDSDDSGLLSYWANEVQRIMQDENLSHDDALAKIEQTIKDTYNIQGNVTFYMNDDEVVFFDKDGNILFRYQLPEDLDHTEYRPLYVLISPDDRHAVIIWERIEHTSQMDPNHPDRHYFYYTKIVFGNNPRIDVIMGNFYGEVNHALMTPDGNYLMIGFSDDSLPDKVMFINLTNNSQIATTPLRGGPGRIVDMISAPDSKRMYLISDNACVTIFDPQTGNVLATIETPWYYTSNWEGKLYISDDGNILTIVDKDGNEVKYDVSDLNNIHQIEEIPPEILQALIPYVEQLLGVPFDEDNPQHQGFLTYWGQRAVKEGLENIENLLQAMITIKDEVEALIGEIDFLDNDYNDDGFITYWAERALRDGLETTEMLLSDMGYLKPLVERGIGRVLNLFDSDDSGLLSYWANEVQRIMQDENLSHDDALAKIEQTIKDTYNIQGNVTFYMNDDEVVFFDKDGNILYTYTLPEDQIYTNGHLPNTYYTPEKVLISQDDTKAIIFYSTTVTSPGVVNFSVVEIDLVNKQEQCILDGSDTNKGRPEFKNAFFAQNDKYIIIGYEGSEIINGTLIGKSSYILFYDYENGKLIANIPNTNLANDGSAIKDMLLSPQEDRLYVLTGFYGKATDAVNIYDVKTGELLARITDNDIAEAKTILISDDGNILTVITNNGKEIKYDVSDLTNIHQIQEIPDEIIDALKPYIQQLLGSYDENNPQHQGLMTYWGQRAVKEGLENIENLLQAMITIKDEVEALIGEIDFLDNDYNDDGFITYWAERALRDGLETTEMLLSDMGYLKPLVERGIGRVLNLFDSDDSGLLSYWANEVQRLMQEEGLSHEEALARVEQRIRETYNIDLTASEILTRALQTQFSTTDPKEVEEAISKMTPDVVAQLVEFAEKLLKGEASSQDLHLHLIVNFSSPQAADYALEGLGRLILWELHNGLSGISVPYNPDLPSYALEVEITGLRGIMDLVFLIITEDVVSVSLCSSS